MAYLRGLFGVLGSDQADVEARCLLALSLWIGNHFLSWPPSTADVVAPRSWSGRPGCWKASPDSSIWRLSGTRGQAQPRWLTYATCADARPLPATITSLTP